MMLVGQKWAIDAEIEDTRTDTLVDVINLIASVKKPDGTSTTATVTRNSRGNYTAEILLDEPGTWHMTTRSSEGEHVGVETTEESVREAPTL